MNFLLYYYYTGIKLRAAIIHNISEVEKTIGNVSDGLLNIACLPLFKTSSRLVWSISSGVKGALESSAKGDLHWLEVKTNFFTQ